jgi:hypothetical protein
MRNLHWVLEESRESKLLKEGFVNSLMDDKTL